jgi:hypothetical protein
LVALKGLASFNYVCIVSRLFVEKCITFYGVLSFQNSDGVVGVAEQRETTVKERGNSMHELDEGANNIKVVERVHGGSVDTDQKEANTIQGADNVVFVSPRGENKRPALRKGPSKLNLLIGTYLSSYSIYFYLLLFFSFHLKMLNREDGICNK